MRKRLRVVFVGALLIAIFSVTAYAKQDTLFNIDVTYLSPVQKVFFWQGRHNIKWHPGANYHNIV